MELHWIIHMPYKQEERRIMSDLCSCPFSDMEISDLEGLEQDVLVEQIVQWLIALSHKTVNVPQILEIASYLPSEKKSARIINLEDESVIAKDRFKRAFLTIRFAINYSINNGFYDNDQKMIKSFSDVLNIHTHEGPEFWKKKLLNSLKADINMKSARVWISNHKEILCIIKSFDFDKEDFNRLLEEALNDEYLKHLDFWIKDRAKVKSLFTLFNISDEIVGSLLDSECGYLADLYNWDKSEESIKNLIELFNLPEERVFQHLKDLIYERFLRCSGLKSMSAEEIVRTFPSLPDYLSSCMLVEKKYFNVFEESKYQDCADELMKTANESSSDDVRKIIAMLATHVYSHISTRAGIMVYSKNSPKQVNNAIFLASKFADYEYIVQKTNDSWWKRNIESRR